MPINFHDLSVCLDICLSMARLAAQKGETAMPDFVDLLAIVTGAFVAGLAAGAGAALAFFP